MSSANERRLRLPRSRDRQTNSGRTDCSGWPAAPLMVLLLPATNGRIRRHVVDGRAGACR